MLSGERRRWLAVVLFAAAMAWMEAATVVYLRTLVGRLEPYQPEPLPIAGHLGAVEVAREAATLLMLGAAGWLAGRNARTRFAYFVLAFGVWDILYYVFLAVIGPWPRSVWDWDILFLIPLPWWGPVLAPASIAALMVIAGSLVSQLDTPERPVWPSRGAWALGWAGATVALYVFMADAMRAAGGGVRALQTVLPFAFDWRLFLVALTLMAAPVVELAVRALSSSDPKAGACREPSTPSSASSDAA